MDARLQDYQILVWGQQPIFPHMRRKVVAISETEAIRKWVKKHYRHAIDAESHGLSAERIEGARST